LITEWLLYLIELAKQPPNPYMEEWFSLIFIISNIIVIWPLVQWAQDVPIKETGVEWYNRCREYDKKDSWWKL